MESLTGMSMFVHVAQTRSFAAAGRLTGVSASGVGKSIARLEQRLGTRLFHRNTRSIALTAEGALFFARCQRILGEVEAAEAELSGAAGAPRGRLKVGAPQLTALLMPLFGLFLHHFPDITLDIAMSDRLVDVIEEGFDLVIRTGAPHDSRLMSRRLGTWPLVMVATPAYLASHGTPLHPGDLHLHACLRHQFPHSGKVAPWPLRDDPRAAAPCAVPETLTCSAIEAVASAAQSGHGLAVLPRLLIDTALREGRLHTVLDGWVEGDVSCWALWPANRYGSPKLRALIDFLGAQVHAGDKRYSSAGFGKNGAAAAADMSAGDRRVLVVEPPM